MANPLLILAEAAAEGAAHAEPTAFGLNPAWYVAAAMTVLLLFAIFGAKAHKTIGSGLDSSISEIRKQLDEARALRAEAEDLRKQYADRIASAEKDAEAMLVHARVEAVSIITKAEADAVAVISRREKMAADKIAAAELAAVSELRTRAANAAAQAARGLIARNHSASADKALVDQAISSI